MHSLVTLSPKQLRTAADLQERILKLQNELSQLLGTPGPATITPADEPESKRHFSPATRAKMRRAQKARWAKIRAEKNAH
jgi:hypothetical protein